MKIAIDAQSIHGKRTGIGTAAYYLLEAMRKQKPDWEWFPYDAGADKNFRTPERILWETFRVPTRARSDKADILYSPGFAPAYFSMIPRVVTVHDLMGLVDSTHLPPGARFYWSKWLPSCIRRAEVLVASSESTKRDIVRFLGRKPESIEVIPLGASSAFGAVPSEDAAKVLKCYGLGEKPYWIAVSTLEPRKNAHGLLRAFRLFLDRFPGCAVLALAGKPGGHETEIKRLIQELDLSNNVKLLGYVSDQDLNALYGGARAFAFVSYYEGFGLPVLEAMTCGRTGVVSNAASLPEVGGEAVLYVDPHDPRSIALAMERVWSQEGLRHELEGRALSRAKEFSWEKAAARMIEVFRRTA